MQAPQDLHGTSNNPLVRDPGPPARGQAPSSAAQSNPLRKEPAPEPATPPRTLALYDPRHDVPSTSAQRFRCENSWKLPPKAGVGRGEGRNGTRTAGLSARFVAGADRPGRSGIRRLSRGLSEATPGGGTDDTIGRRSPSEKRQPLRPHRVTVPEGSHVFETALIEVAVGAALVTLLSLGWWIRICAADRERSRLKRGTWRREAPRYPGRHGAGLRARRNRI